MKMILFADDVIVENNNQQQQKSCQLISDHNKAVGYKIKTQKISYFPIYQQ